MHCPVCERGSRFHLEEKCSHNMEQNVVNYEIYKCDFCGSSFSHPLYSAPADYYDYSVPDWRWEFGEFIEDLEKLYPNGGNVLEIGCNEGNLLKRLDRNKYQTLGIDFNEPAIQKAVDKDLKCYALTVDGLKEKFQDLEVDVVSFFHVLEHVENPFELLTSLKSILKPNGQIVFSVPNPHRLLLLAGRESGDYPPHHLLRFSINGIQNLITRAGFKIVSIKHHPRDINLFDFVSQSTYELFKRLHLSGIYNSSLPRWIRAIIKFPFYSLLFPYASFKFLTNLRLPGSALYVICQKGN